MALTTIYYDLSIDDFVNNKTWKKHIEKFYKWCSENCTGYYCVELVGMSLRCDFEEIEEAMAFKLRWF